MPYPKGRRPPNFRDLTGRQFSRLKVISFAGIQKQQSYWLCQCSCGKTTKVMASRLNDGWTKSCGCLQSETRALNGKRNLRHGRIKTSEYYAWADMKSRCLYPKDWRYPEWGGRGITICQNWIDSFEAFFNDMGLRPGPGYSLDRINNDGNYEPSNCRWATAKEQASNRRPQR